MDVWVWVLLERQQDKLIENRGEATPHRLLAQPSLGEGARVGWTVCYMV